MGGRFSPHIHRTKRLMSWAGLGRLLLFALGVFCLLVPLYTLSSLIFDSDPSFLEAEQVEVTNRVFLDVDIDGKPAGRIVLGLFGKVVPKTVKNFVELVQRENDKGYRGTVFHRVIPGFIVQGGAGITSIYGNRFPDENFHVRHSTGALSMANEGVNTNNAEFFITMTRAGHLNGKHVVFGKVIEGMSTVNKVSRLQRNASDYPRVKSIIAACGIL